MMKCGIAALSLFSKKIMIEYLTSIFVIPCLQSAGGGFDIRYSLFQSFFLDLTGRSRPEAALNTDTFITLQHVVRKKNLMA
jgi:hypothetical protein